MIKESIAKVLQVFFKVIQINKFAQIRLKSVVKSGEEP